MTTGTGLDASVGAKLESVVGTPVTVDKHFEFDKCGIKWEPTWIEPSGLRVGTKYKRASRLTQSRTMVSGPLEMQHATRLMGMWWKLCLGSSVTTPTLVAASAYKQIHTPGDFMGKAATIQAGKPEPSGTIRPHTYTGCKVTGWEFTIGDDENATLSMDIDGWDESTATALVAASFVNANAFSFRQASFFKLGGTASTASGEVSIAAGTSVTAVVKKISIKGETPMATERFGLGSAGIKKEQLENDIPTITVDMDAEWNRAEFYDLYKAGDTTAFELRLVGDVISGSDTELLSFVIPALQFKDVPAEVDGPDIISMSVSAEVYADGTNAPFQVKIVSADSAAL